MLTAKGIMKAARFNDQCRYEATFAWACPHCGREYSTDGHKTGFVKKAASTHIWCCGRRTPAERRACNRTAEAQWKKRRPKSLIRNNPGHPGLVDDHA